MPDRDSKKPTAPPAPEPLRVAVADSHTHLDMQSGSVADAVAQAAAVGVDTLVQVGCDLPGSRWAAETAAAWDTIWATVALHPNEAPRVAGRASGGGRAGLDAEIDAIDALAALPHVLGVGETGLDYFRTGPEGVEDQQHSFRRHIDIAKRHGKALVIHDRDAHADVLRILAEEGAPSTVVFHCYSGDAEMATVCAEHGYYMSFAGTVSYKSAQNLRDAVAVAPRDLLLVETDAPFLTPVPYRGRPNAPYLIPVTLRAMAAARGDEEDQLAAAIAANTARVFGYDTAR
jgi:TatD DNase family protein